MISHRYRCIFVEVPKTGTSSIRAVIGSPPRPHLDICQIRMELRTHWTRHGNIQPVLAALYGLLPRGTRSRIGEARFQSYYKFGFVRNPWDRAVSLYLRREGLRMRDRMTFDEFIAWMRYSSSTCINSVPHTNQLDWFVDPSGELLVDTIGRFENLAADWASIARKIGATEALPGRNRNRLRDRHYTEYYSDTSRELVRARFRVDIERFGYEFGA